MPWTAIIFAVVVCVTGCRHTPLPSLIYQENRIPFTYQLRRGHEIPPETLKELQYYVSGTITLRRQRQDDIEEIVIEGGTPGVAVEVNPNSLAISFEEGSYLWFGSTESTREQWQGKYVLLADKWEQGVGTIHFDGKVYSAAKGSGQAYLLIDREWERQEELPGIHRRELRGRRTE